jgi:hypothetical protein
VAPLALPAGLFGPSIEAPERRPEGGPGAIETISGTELAARAGGGAEGEIDHDKAAGPRHVHDREVLVAMQRRLLEEQERMGGFGALIR